MDSQSPPTLHLSNGDIAELLAELNTVRTQELSLPEGSDERWRYNLLFKERHYTLQMARVPLYWDDRIKAYVLISPVEIDILISLLNGCMKDLSACEKGSEEHEIHARHLNVCWDKLKAAAVPIYLADNIYVLGGMMPS